MCWVMDVYQFKRRGSPFSPLMNFTHTHIHITHVNLHTLAKLMKNNILYLNIP